MKKVSCVAVIFLLSLGAASSLWAECKINNISLERDSTFTKLVIYGNAPFEYKHSAVDAKDGKPYRIVVDIEDAVHALPQNNFSDIPEGTITAIRTSQFAVEPKRTVRIVLDVKNPIVYRTEKEKENQMCVVISTPQDKNFPFWAADMTPFKEKQLKTAQTTRTEKESQREQARLVETKQTTQVQVKEKKEKMTEKRMAQRPVKKEEGEGVLKREVAQETPSRDREKKAVPEVKPEAKSEAKPGTRPEAKPEVKPEVRPEETESSATETNKVAQLKEKAEREAEAIKAQAEKIKPRGEVIEAVYKRKVVAYSSEGQRDPFTPVGEKINAEFGKAPQPAYETLKLVGILKDVSGNMALMEDGEGYGYIMRVGDKVKNGEVIYVGDDKVLFQIAEYGWSKTVAVELYRKE